MQKGDTIRKRVVERFEEKERRRRVCARRGKEFGKSLSLWLV
jgi:hypothetical protein